jgi:hypothetical protein
MRTRRRLSIISAALVVVGSSLFGAQSASALTGGVWFQSIGRASETAACPDHSFGTPWQSDWNPSEQSWRPTYSQWMNGGAGGWTCDRQITWAQTARAYPSAGCVNVNYIVPGEGSDPDITVDFWVDFGGGWFVADADTFDFSTCAGSTYDTGYYAVYAPSGWGAADLCQQAFPTFNNSPRQEGNEGVWQCFSTG